MPFGKEIRFDLISVVIIAVPENHRVVPFASRVCCLGKLIPVEYLIHDPCINDLGYPTVQQPPGLVLSLLISIPLVFPSFWTAGRDIYTPDACLRLGLAMLRWLGTDARSVISCMEAQENRSLSAL